MSFSLASFSLTASSDVSLMVSLFDFRILRRIFSASVSVKFWLVACCVWMSPSATRRMSFESWSLANIAFLMSALRVSEIIWWPFG